ncbi:hypothetical protein M404DRAFT_871254 [Pisolithus tinctorius Marx 270]|uniref:Uncharacterized protein n=1 Tax=Pisolithus tinctorius Marx 270 TaxID=870435 RepID=A0A0C3JN94_PISTI|nr:hypothetical protein M404DRAFT_871254 [Pisolithus tinctorius Marx 270]
MTRYLEARPNGPIDAQGSMDAVRASARGNLREQIFYVLIGRGLQTYGSVMRSIWDAERWTKHDRRTLL